MKDKMVFLCLIVIISLFAVAAQSDRIEIHRNAAELDFPDSISFHLAITSQVEVEKITLIYGTNGRSCQDGGARQTVDFEGDDPITASWLWELDRSGGLPPGVEVWWQWEIVPADGAVMLTDRQTIINVDSSQPWQSIERDNVIVNWYAGDVAFAETILDEAVNSLDRSEASLGLPRPDRVELFVYASATAVKDAILFVPEWTGGVAFPKYGVTVLGISPDNAEWAANIVPHELTHLVEGMLTFNCRGVNLPTWLTEGLARYAEGEADLQEVAQMEAALADGRLPSLSSLNSGFSAYSGSASLAYTQSGQVVGYLIESYGAAQMTQLLQTMQGGLEIDDALPAVYGFDTNGLDVAWRTSKGVAPTPTAQAADGGVDNTPTPVPTLALGGIPGVTPTLPMTPSPMPAATEVAQTAVSPEPPPTQTALPTIEKSEPLPATATIETTAADSAQVDDGLTPASPFPWMPVTAFALLIIVVAFFVFKRGSS